MDENKLKDLLISKKIDKVQFKIYSLFELNDQGREFLKLMCDSVLLEEPQELVESCFAWHDGRRSVWRHIKLTINFIEKTLGEINA